MTSVETLFSRYQRIALLALASICMAVVLAILPSTPASAADGDDGEYDVVQLAHYDSFYVYAKSGEFVHFRLQPGYYDNPWSKDNGGHKARCAYVYIYRENGTLADSDSTCNSSNVPKSTHLWAQNTTPGPQLFNVVFTPETVVDDGADQLTESLKRCNSSDICDTQGYQWKIWVNNNIGDNDNGLQTGRVYVDPENGLRVWQHVRSGNNHGSATDTLQYHRTDLKFVYARKDGYRYLVNYKNFHGIWSEFYSGVYGIYDSSGQLAYRSIKKGQSGYTVQTFDSGGNNAYLFLDCRGAYMDCTGIKDTLGLNDDTLAYPIANSSGVGAGASGNPIIDVGNHTSSTNTAGFRFTGFSTAGGVYSGGTVTVPYTRMQSGYINVWIKDETAGNITLSCQRTNQNFPAIDDPDGTGSITFNPTCINGISTTHVLRIYAQATHLGEMHFINTDVESRGGVTVQGNGLYAASPRNQYGLIYNDPFSTSAGSMCGTIQGRYKLSGGLQSNNDGTTGVNRQPIDSFTENGGRGAHGWLTNNCDNTASSGSTKSAWGNNRNIEDWVYSYQDPAPRSFALGGSTYELTPNVTANPERVATNQPAIFSYTVDNDQANSNVTAWSIRSVIVRPGVTLPSDYFDGFDGAGRTCASYYRAAGIVSNPALVTCDDVATEPGSSGSGRFPGTTIADQTINQSYPVGTRICRALIVDSRNESPAPNARSSALTCALVAVTPTVQIWGSDIRVGSGFVTGDSTSASIKSYLTFVDGNYRGSWTEYGAIAPTSISNFGSASGLNALNTASGNALSWSKLTFANNTIGTLGNFTSADDLGQIPDVRGYMVANATRAGLTLKQPAVSVSLGAYEANTVYVVNGTATITGDIKNTSPRAGVNTLTQMVIIADAINILPNVQQIDAWLITPGGTINTCLLPGVDQRLSTNVCNAVLHINGPLMADTVLPRRTSGAGKDPAEVFSLRGDAYMWARKISEANGSIHTSYLTELPPRY